MEFLRNCYTHIRIKENLSMINVIPMDKTSFLPQELFDNYKSLI